MFREVFWCVPGGDGVAIVHSSSTAVIFTALCTSIRTTWVDFGWGCSVFSVRATIVELFNVW